MPGEQVCRNRHPSSYTGHGERHPASLDDLRTHARGTIRSPESLGPGVCLCFFFFSFGAGMEPRALLLPRTHPTTGPHPGLQGSWERGMFQDSEEQGARVMSQPQQGLEHTNLPYRGDYEREVSCPSRPVPPPPAFPPGPGPPYLQEVITLAGQDLALPPALQEPPELHEEQQEAVLELLGLLHQQVLLLAPELLLQPPLEAQTLQLELPPQQRPLLVLLQLRGQETEQGQLRVPALPALSRPRSRAGGELGGPVGDPSQKSHHKQLILSMEE